MAFPAYGPDRGFRTPRDTSDRPGATSDHQPPEPRVPGVYGVQGVSQPRAGLVAQQRPGHVQVPAVLLAVEGGLVEQRDLRADVADAVAGDPRGVLHRHDVVGPSLVGP